MCISLAAAAIISTLVAAGTTAAAAKSQSDFQGDLAERNAESERLRGEEAKKQGLISEEQHRAKVKQIIGAQRAALGASNLDINTGSAAKLQEDALRFGEQDALTIRSNAERAAWGINVGAQSEELSGGMARRAGSMSAFSTVLAGGARAYGQYREYAGTPPPKPPAPTPAPKKK